MATLEVRWDNALRRAAVEHVRPIGVGRGTYVVASSAVPVRGYLVRLLPDGRITCTCPAGQWAFPCKHAAAVSMLGERRQEARVGDDDRQPKLA